MKLTDFTTPTGAKGNLLSLSSLWGMILGVVVFLITLAVGQNLLGKIGARLPFDTQIDPFIKAQSTSQMRESY